MSSGMNHMVLSMDRNRARSRCLFFLSTIICSIITIALIVMKQPIYDIAGAAGVAIFSLNTFIENEYAEINLNGSMIIAIISIAALAYLARTVCAMDSIGLGKTLQDIFAALVVLIEVGCDVVFLLLAAFRLVFDHRI